MHMDDLIKQRETALDYYYHRIYYNERKQWT